MRMKKCYSCPYKLGFIKTIISPCPDCISSKRNVSSFSKIIKADKTEDKNEQSNINQKRSYREN